MEFEWDEAKNRTNVSKHGIDFETAKRIFDGPVLSPRDSFARIMVRTATSASDAWATRRWSSWSYTDRGGRSMRLISARPASRKERQAWHAHIR